MAESRRSADGDSRACKVILMTLTQCMATMLVLTVPVISLIVADDRFFEVHVIDSETRLGVPMVELTTVDDVTYITDSAGRIALREPELAACTVYFKVHSPGYKAAKDGFRFAGVRAVIEPGKPKISEITRTSVAERMYRVTGRDIYLDTVRLGHPSPLKHPLSSGL